MKSTHDTFETEAGKSFLFFNTFLMYVAHCFSGNSPHYSLHYTVYANSLQKPQQNLILTG
jgi:hypothetical protein